MRTSGSSNVTRTYSRQTSPILHASDLKLGDILFVPRDPTMLLLIADIRQEYITGKDIYVFTTISSGSGKIHEVTESVIALLRMRKVKNV